MAATDLRAVATRLVHLGGGRFRVQRADTGKVLGIVDRAGRYWRAGASMRAFLGDGPGGGEPLSDHVPVALYWPLRDTGDLHLPGHHRTHRDAVGALLAYLDEQRAPALGHPAHPDVTHQEGAATR